MDTRLGLELHRDRRLVEAEAAYRLSLSHDPGDARAWHLLGMLLCQTRRPTEGLAALQRSVQLAPDVAEFHNNLAGALGSSGKHAEAESALRRALALRPGYGEALDNLGVSLENQARFDEAAEALARAAGLLPASHVVRLHLSNTLRKRGHPDAAEHAARDALRLAPNHADSHNALGAALTDLNRVPEAADAFRHALALNPHLIDAQLNLAMAQIALGQWEEGFPRLMCRWRHPMWGRKLPGSRLETLEAIEGKTLLLYQQGGSGDAIQFARYVPLLADRGATVLIECRPELAPLLRTLSDVYDVIPRGEILPPFDFVAAFDSLPGLHRTTLDTVPASVTYLHPPQQEIERWKPAVQALPGCRVGVCWQGEQKLVHLRRRSFDPHELLPLARLPGVTLLSLQHGPPMPPDVPIRVLPGLDHRSITFLAAAAVIKSLDLVVSCDTSIAHLAGALGVPTWVALPYASCGRWMLARPDSPWYPTLRLFRQERPGDWSTVFARIAGGLRDRGGPADGRA